MSKIGDVLLSALRARYEADEAECLATIEVYLRSPVGIGEHPQHLDEMNKLVSRLVDARDKRDAVAGLMDSCTKDDLILEVVEADSESVVMCEDVARALASRGETISVHKITKMVKKHFGVEAEVVRVDNKSKRAYRGVRLLA